MESTAIVEVIKVMGGVLTAAITVLGGGYFAYKATADKTRKGQLDKIIEELGNMRGEMTATRESVAENKTLLRKISKTGGLLMEKVENIEGRVVKIEKQPRFPGMNGHNLNATGI